MKKSTRTLVLASSFAMTLSLAACNSATADASSLKVGLILLHPAASSTYDKNFYDAMVAAKEKLGFTLVVKENINEDGTCETTAKEMAEDGCDIVFADSFGHEDFLIQAAKAYPDVEFCHATGTKAATVNNDPTAPVKNFHNAFASIYEGRFLAGVVAGQKMAEDIAAGKYTAEQAKIGYVGAHPYAEVISGFTSFYLGARSVVPSVTMDVVYTNSWYDYDAEFAKASALIESGAKLISQHADSYGAPKACEDAGIPNVAYNGATDSAAPNTYLVSSKIDWQPYYEHIIDCVLNEKEISSDYVGTVETGSVQLTKYGASVSEEAKSKVADAKAKLADGTLHVFDGTKFTVNGGQTPTNENMAPNKTWTFNYPDGTDFMKDGYYHESYYRSAPSFDVIIDGINSIVE